MTSSWIELSDNRYVNLAIAEMIKVLSRRVDIRWSGGITTSYRGVDAEKIVAWLNRSGNVVR